MNQRTLMFALAILIFIGFVIAVIASYIKRKENRKPNYKLFFIIGLCWTPLGIATQNYVFIIIGLVFLIVGVINKKNWEAQPKWSDLSPEARKVKIAMMIFLAAILIMGLIFYLIAQY